MPSFHGFSGVPRVQPVAPRLVETLDSLLYIDASRHLSILVQRGFRSDGASVPRAGWLGIRSNWLELLSYGLLHDYLYREDAHVIVFGKAQLVPSRNWADVTGRRALLSQDGNPRRDANRIYLGTRLAGKAYWHKRTVGWRG